MITVHEYLVRWDTLGRPLSLSLSGLVVGILFSFCVYVFSESSCSFQSQLQSRPERDDCIATHRYYLCNVIIQFHIKYI